MTNEEPNINELKAKIEELTKENSELKENNSLDEIQNKYKEIIAEKDNEIKTLKTKEAEAKANFKAKEEELANSVVKELEATEQYKEILATVQELKQQQAETIVENYIQKGIILPAQRKTAVKLALKDSDTFNELYKDAEPIVPIEKKRKSIVPNDTLEKMSNYFKQK